MWRKKKVPPHGPKLGHLRAGQDGQGGDVREEKDKDEYNWTGKQCDVELRSDFKNSKR